MLKKQKMEQAVATSRKDRFFDYRFFLGPIIAQIDFCSLDQFRLKSIKEFRKMDITMNEWSKSFNWTTNYIAGFQNISELELLFSSFENSEEILTVLHRAENFFSINTINQSEQSRTDVFLTRNQYE